MQIKTKYAKAMTLDMEIQDMKKRIAKREREKEKILMRIIHIRINHFTR